MGTGEGVNVVRRGIPAALMLIGVWTAVLVGLTYLGDTWLTRQQNPNLSVETRVVGDNQQEVSLAPNRNGHYVLTVEINGHEVVAMIDTGATDVSIPLSVAERIGLERGPTVRYQTAGGLVDNHITWLDRVSVGGIEVRDVRGSINPRLSGDKVLLGMSFLTEVEFAQQSGQLHMRSLPAGGR